MCSGQRVMDSAKPQLFHPSSFILHPSSFSPHPSSSSLKPGYTLVEILVATALTLLLMGAVVQMFGALGKSITDSRSFLEASERLRSAASRLQMDLQALLSQCSRRAIPMTAKDISNTSKDR